MTDGKVEFKERQDKCGIKGKGDIIEEELERERWNHAHRWREKGPNGCDTKVPSRLL